MAIESSWINDNLYKGYLGRAADTSGLDYWTKQAAANNWDAATLKSNFTASAAETLKNYDPVLQKALAPNLYKDPVAPVTPAPVIPTAPDKPITPTIPTVQLPKVEVPEKDWTGLLAAIQQTQNTPREVTANETVSGQLDKLLASDSPLLQSARATGYSA